MRDASVTGNPIPLTTQYVLVSNLCPECQWGDLDFEEAGDGRWGIQWCAPAAPTSKVGGDQRCNQAAGCISASILI
jgi:hypothetical protein